MKISIKNLGPIKQAEFELGELTIICGENNTGKTYATYALYGFLASWRNTLPVIVSAKNIHNLLNKGNITVDIKEYIDKAQLILKRGCDKFTNRLPEIFASSAKNFTDSRFSISLNVNNVQLLPEYSRLLGAATNQLLAIRKQAASSQLDISLLGEQDKTKIPPEIIRRTIEETIINIVFDGLFPRPFIVSAERTGAAIFRKDLPFTPHNGLLEEVAPKTKPYTEYAQPIKFNLEITRLLEESAKHDSFIAKEHRDILFDFIDIVGGSYRIAEPDLLYFIPKGKEVKLTMGESSSSVRSLLLLAFYFAHMAAKGDLLMIDEPELNLHPENQRKVARLFARLANIGIKVFITTHSDYIIKELNTLIMLNQDVVRLKELAEREGYKTAELLNADKVKVYIAENSTLVPADIDPQDGIEVSSFDKSINDMNRIQDEIVWGGDE